MADISLFCYTDHGTKNKQENDNEKKRAEKNNGICDDFNRLYRTADQKGEKRETWQF